VTHPTTQNDPFSAFPACKSLSVTTGRQAQRRPSDSLRRTRLHPHTPITSGFFTTLPNPLNVATLYTLTAMQLPCCGARTNCVCLFASLNTQTHTGCEAQRRPSHPLRRTRLHPHTPHHQRILHNPAQPPKHRGRGRGWRRAQRTCDNSRGWCSSAVCQVSAECLHDCGTKYQGRSGGACGLRHLAGQPGRQLAYYVSMRV
jgi:hypothetical protein